MTSGNDDDWLWECAFQQEESRTVAAQTKFLVPDWEEEAHHYISSKGHQLHHTVKVCSHNHTSSITDIDIRVVEIRGNGVLDTIGGEVWEASLLLCAYILLNPQIFLSVSTLELGSGLGLPAFLINELRSLLLHLHPVCTSTTSSSSTACDQQGKRTCLTDNDPRCIDTLIATMKSRYDVDHNDNDEESSMPSANHCYLSVATLDWNAYRGKNVLPHLSELSIATAATAAVDAANPPSTPELSINHPLHPTHYQLLFGSALIYSPYHVCLADTLLHFMQSGVCQRVCIVQIADRAGFEEFLQRLTGLTIQYTVEPISEDVYNTAQRIGCKISSPISVSATAAPSPTSQSNVSVKSDRIQSTDEDEVQVEKHFLFPRDLIEQAIHKCVFAQPTDTTTETHIDTVTVTDTPETTTTAKTAMAEMAEKGLIRSDQEGGLIHTDRSAFVLMHAWL